MRWTIVRNAIVHASRRATPELCAKWPDRFPRPGMALTLTDQDVKDVASLSQELVGAVDERLVVTVIGEADARDLVCTLFHDLGMTEPAAGIAFVTDALATTLDAPAVADIHEECRRGRRRYP